MEGVKEVAVNIIDPNDHSAVLFNCHQTSLCNCFKAKDVDNAVLRSHLLVSKLIFTSCVIPIAAEIKTTTLLKYELVAILEINGCFQKLSRATS